MKNCTYVFRAVFYISVFILAGILPASSQQIEKGLTSSTGDYLGFLEYKPLDYDKTSTKYPLIIFLHGIGERGNGTTELKNVSCCGIPRIIKLGHKMKFTWNGKTETFLVVSPQCPKKYGMWPAVFITELIEYAKQNLKIDTNRIFLSGLSMGGGGTFRYISTAPEQPKKLAGAATICAPCTFANGTYVPNAKLPLWSFHAADDPVASVTCTQNAIKRINDFNPVVKPLMTIWPTGGHVVWDRVYTDTSYKFDGVLNIYEWFLGQNKSLGANKLPVAKAGNAINITTGTAVASISGAASTDADGKIVRYVWKKISGPAAGVITNHFGPNSSTTITGLTVAGTYQYQLSVVDDRAGFSRDTLTINVTAGGTTSNKAPVAKAGSDISITLPTNTVTLDGSGSTDEDGTIASYLWTKVSGPAATIANSASSATGVNNLAQGTYVFKLKVTDNNGASSEDQVTVTVNAAPLPQNIAPLAKAGTDITITLPTNTVNLNGSGSSDQDGSITAYLWTKTSGPAATIANANASTTAVNSLVEGTYVFDLKVTDNNGASSQDQVTVKVNPAPPPPNIAPESNAGSDISITLPVNKTVLTGSASTDADGTIATYSWTRISGPTQFIIADASVANTNLTNLAQGTYKFRLLVTDNKGAQDADTVVVNVNPAPPPPNVAPVAQAGANQTITLPVDNVTLDGNASSDADGTIASFSWTYLTGPASFVITDGSSAVTSVSGMIAGTYSFRLEVIDNDGAADADTITVTVKEAAAPPPPPNVAPVGKAGNDQTITLPLNEVTLNGSNSTDGDGTIANYSWTKIGGPATFNIVTPGGSSTVVENLAEGAYLFKLQVKDNDGALGIDTVKITVLPAQNIAPVSNAGNDLQVQLPDPTIQLSGIDSHDPDGTIETYNWTMVSGPGIVTIANPSSMATGISVVSEGEYVFRLTVTDNDGGQASDVVKVTVLAATPNAAPVANAGTDIQASLPNAVINLNGADSYDPDGTIATYSWVKISGPGGVTITNSTSAIPGVVGVEAGEYVFRLTVTDNNGMTASDSVKVMVQAEPTTPVTNVAPVANAGPNQNITYPESSVVISGTNSNDEDGSIASYTWSILDGSVNATIVTPAAATTMINNLETGEYSFLLTIVDDKGAVSRDTVTISVINTLRYVDNFNVYPNPARSNINMQLTSDTTGAAKISIYNASGVLVQSVNSEKTQAQLIKNLNISSLQNGLYYLEVIVAGKQRMIKKFVKRQ